MLYNVIVLNHVSGVTLATIRLSDEGINENDGILMAGVVKAIRDFLQELKIGKIHTGHWWLRSLDRAAIWTKRRQVQGESVA